MKLAVCGDSFFSIDSAFPGRSFGEYVCAKNEWTLVSLARPGVSNFAIALQIDQAIKEKVDFVIVGTTSADRTELPLKENVLYKKSNGVANLKPRSHPYGVEEDQTICAWPISYILEQKYNNFSKEQKQQQALKEYVLHCYDTNVKRQYDSWIISDACRRLINNNIPFLLFYEHLYNLWSNIVPDKTFLKDVEWIPKKYLVDVDEFAFRRDVPIPNKAVFHYCENHGFKIWGDYVEKRIRELQ